MTFIKPIFLINKIMYKLFFIFFVSLLPAQQECKLTFSNSPLSKDGKIIFIVKNLNEKKVKIADYYGSDWARPINIQVYNTEKNTYDNTGYSFDGANCLKLKDCFGKMVTLKKGCYKEYEVNIIPGRISSAFKEKKKYRFKLAFDTYLFSGCNDYVTDWFYFDNSNK